MLVADEIYGLTPNGYTPATGSTHGWLLSYVLWAAAALHPVDGAALEAASASTALRVSPVRIVLLVGRAPERACGAARPGRARSAARTCRPSSRRRSIVVLVVLAHGSCALVRGSWRARANGSAARCRTAAHRGRPAEGRVRRADLARPAHAADVDHGLRRARARRRDRAAARRGAPRATSRSSSRSSERLLRLVDDLLFVARLQSGRLVLDAGAARPVRASRGRRSSEARRARRARRASSSSSTATARCSRGGQGPPVPAARQPRLERDQVHARGRPGRRSASAATATAPSSR